jgi:hypothetical protein
LLYHVKRDECVVWFYNGDKVVIEVVLRKNGEISVIRGKVV